MDTGCFHRLTTAITPRLSRRNAVKGGLGFGAAAFGVASLHAAATQEATPAATPAPGAGEEDRTFFLFVQTFHAGTLTPHATEADTYTLTLTGGPDQTVYFSDRPERIVGTVSTTQFLDGLGFSPENPPNAALVAQTDEGEDIVVVELFNPVYTKRFEPEAGVTLTYDVKVLADYQEDGLAHLAARQSDASLPASFGAASLFIDDCADHDAYCERYDASTLTTTEVGHLGPVGYCWHFGDLWCKPCRNYDVECNATFPDCQNRCFAAEYN